MLLEVSWVLPTVLVPVTLCQGKSAGGLLGAAYSPATPRFCAHG